MSEILALAPNWRMQDNGQSESVIQSRDVAVLQHGGWVVTGLLALIWSKAVYGKESGEFSFVFKWQSVVFTGKR
ncbi:hypothetical protein TH25_01830 [Thalassospira profundimaris]|uniref:Uncharacterized protein n=1 Tax=Thalassospira profundimaris TaxID=502049 RepID=A0A367XMQ8_9PROT|nr:hypothetical protein TH25_01830 [Thalassospira profundimaris]